MIRFAILLVAAASLVGCATSEINAEHKLGLSGDVPSGTPENGYGDMRGDSVAPPGGDAEEKAGTDTRTGE